MSTPYVIATFDAEGPLFEAVRALRAAQVRIEEVYTPYPVHNLDQELGYKRSRLPIAAFLFGVLGATLAITMQIAMMTRDWPMNIGGKDFLPFPTFIPVTFEMTVLLSAFGMVAVFFVVSNLKPWGKPKLFDPRQTQDRHVVVIALDNQPIEAGEIQAIVERNAASCKTEKV